jgi:uncharacterized repeat protein (TIGR04138 family)
VSYNCVGANRLGREGLSDGSSFCAGGVEAKILIMRAANFEENIRKIVEHDPRYPFDAYVFVQEALKHTQRALGRNKTAQKHVGGKELLEGIRLYALKTFGPMVPTMLEEWGIHSCEDFGVIVFNMIAHKMATKSETDRMADFKDGYDFDDAFRKPFRPSKPSRLKTKSDTPKVGVRN